MSAAIYARDINKSGSNFYDDGGIEPESIRSYFKKYIRLDPFQIAHFFAEPEQLMSTTDVMPFDELFETRFYKEWARPLDLADTLTTTLDKSSGWAAFLTIFRHKRDGIFDDEARRRARLIVPHFRRAVMIGRLLDRKTLEAETLSDTLDGLAAGVILVDATGRIVHANAAGHRVLAAGEVLQESGGRLAHHDPAIWRMLQETFAAAKGGDAAIGVKGIAVPLRTRGGDDYVAHVLPLTSGARRSAGLRSAATAALFVQKAMPNIASAPEVIAKRFSLTPTELRVLLGIVEMGGVPGTAEALGIAESTVRTHLKRLFDKTGASRQAELVKLVAGFSNPLIG